MDAIYERGCKCPQVPCPYHATPSRPFNEMAEGVARDFYEALAEIAIK